MAKETYGPAMLRRIACAVFGHSRIVTKSWSYVYCVRCEAQVGDTLAGVWNDIGAVIFGHKCQTCESNYRSLSLWNKLFIRNPLT